MVRNSEDDEKRDGQALRLRSGRVKNARPTKSASLLLHEGGDGAEFFDNAGHVLEHVVNVGVGGVTAEAEADRAVRGGERHAHGADHVRRFERAG